MISNILFIWSQSQCLLQADLSFTKQSPLNVENTEVVLTLDVIGLYLQDPDRHVTPLVFIHRISVIFTSYSRILPGLDLSCGLCKYPPSV